MTANLTRINYDTIFRNAHTQCALLNIFVVLIDVHLSDAGSLGHTTWVYHLSRLLSLRSRSSSPWFTSISIALHMIRIILVLNPCHHYVILLQLNDIFIQYIIYVYTIYALCSVMCTQIIQYIPKTCQGNCSNKVDVNLCTIPTLSVNIYKVRCSGRLAFWHVALLGYSLCAAVGLCV